MSITLNTYGIRSINAESFNTYGSPGAFLPRSIRDLANTLLRINNLVLNVLGYIPGVSLVSGSVRLGIGVSIVILTLALGSPNAEQGLIIDRWYNEALITGAAQVARGTLEAFASFGGPVNMILDIVGTVFNLQAELFHCDCSIGPMDDDSREAEARPPYRDPDYPVFLSPLYLA